MRKRIRDSALYRLARNIGFNARVEPIWYSYRHLESRMGFFERWSERRRVKRFVVLLRSELQRRGVADASWEDRSGECVCNLRVARAGLVAELQSFLREQAPASHVKQWSHLMAQQDRNACMMPVDFDEPFSAGAEASSVTSAPRIKEELVQVNQLLRIDETFALAKAKKVDYLDATEKDISAYESRFGTMEGFWSKFTYVLLKKLAETSVQHKLPAFFA